MHVFGGRIRSGVESVVLELAEQLRQNGGEPILVPLVDGPFSDEARSVGFTVVPLNKRYHLDLFSIYKMHRLIREYRPDIIHSHAINGAFYACLAGPFEKQVAQVTTVHIDTKQSLVDAIRWSPPRSMAAAYHQWLMRWCQQVTTVNSVIRDDLVRKGVPADKVVSIPNGIELTPYEDTKPTRKSICSELGIPENATLIGTACRLSPFKNLDMLLAVARQLIQKKELVELVIIGDGPERERLGSLAEEIGIHKHVHFTGWRNDVARVINALDIFVVTSDVEGGPIVALEAMALGKPLVSTAVGIAVDLKEHLRAGLIVPTGDTQKMTSAIFSLLRDEEFANQIGIKGQMSVRDTFSTEKMYRSYSETYIKACNQVPENISS